MTAIKSVIFIGVWEMGAPSKKSGKCFFSGTYHVKFVNIVIFRTNIMSALQFVCFINIKKSKHRLPCLYAGDVTPNV